MELTSEERKAYEKAGRVAAQALMFGARQIKPGVRMREVLDSTEEYVRKHGCGIAFPAQSSINSIAAHYCPTEADDLTYQEGDVAKIDVGAHYEGYIGDTALTVSLGKEHQRLVDATVKAVQEASKLLRPGCTPDEIGRAIQETAHKHGFQPIRNLSGHGLARYTIHTSPSMPNYPSGERGALAEGQVVTLEPFLTTGATGLITSSGQATVFTLQDRPVRGAYARDVQKLAAQYHGLPFTTRWLTRQLGSKALLGLSELRRARSLVEYPPLVDKSGGLVAQHEHTFLITKSGCKTLTMDEE